MRNRSLLFFTFTLIIIFGTLHLLAGIFYFYWTLWWFDYLMHFLGGLSLGLFFLWIFYASGFAANRRERAGLSGLARPARLQAVFMSLIPVLILGIGWEIFEFVNGITQATEESYTLDVAHDLLADGLGAFAASIIGRWRGFYNNANK